jgi:hypothetical protein
LEGRRNLQGDLEHVGPGEPALLVDDLFEAQAFDVFHGVEVEAVFIARFIEADDVGMIEPAQGLDLALETVEEADFLGQLGGEDFQSRLAPGQLFLRKVNAPHAAAAQFLEDDPFAQPVADHAMKSAAEERFVAAFIVSFSSGGYTIRRRSYREERHENGLVGDRAWQPSRGCQ